MVDTANMPAPTKTSTGTPTDPNIHLYQWLIDNNYELSVDAMSDKNPFLDGKGFVLTDKPLLVVTVKKKEVKG